MGEPTDLVWSASSPLFVFWDCSFTMLFGMPSFVRFFMYSALFFLLAVVILVSIGSILYWYVFPLMLFLYLVLFIQSASNKV